MRTDVKPELILDKMPQTKKLGDRQNTVLQLDQKIQRLVKKLMKIRPKVPKYGQITIMFPYRFLFKYTQHTHCKTGMAS